MFGWLPASPDPAIVGDRWKEMWRNQIKGMSFWFDQWTPTRPAIRTGAPPASVTTTATLKCPSSSSSGWRDGCKESVDHVLQRLSALGKPVTAMLGVRTATLRRLSRYLSRLAAYVTTHWVDRWLRGLTRSVPGGGVHRVDGPVPQARYRHRTTPTRAGGSPRITVDEPIQAGDLLPRARARRLRRRPGARFPRPRPQRGRGAAQHRHRTHRDQFVRLRGQSRPARDQTADDKQAITFDSAPLSTDLECSGTRRCG